MEYIGVITHLLTIDPNFQRDILVDCVFERFPDPPSFPFFFFGEFNGCSGVPCAPTVPTEIEWQLVETHEKNQWGNDDPAGGWWA